MAAAEYNDFELVLMLMQMLHEAGVQNPLQIKPDITDYINELPDKWVPIESKDRFTGLGTHIFTLFHVLPNKVFVMHNDKGWFLTAKGHEAACDLLARNPTFKKVAKETALLSAFIELRTKETWLAIGKYYGWTKTH